MDKFQKKLIEWYSENTKRLTNSEKITILKGCDKAMGNIADKELWQAVSNCQKKILKETNYFELPKSSVSKMKLLVTEDAEENLAFVLP